MQSPQSQLKQVRRILALWPSQAGEDGEELLRGYLLAVEDYPAPDVELAIDTLIKGVAPGVNPSYRPKPSEVGAECRRHMNLRLDREARGRLALPPPPEPEIPEAERERVKAGFAALLAYLSSKLRTEDAEAERRHRERLQRTNARFDRELEAARGYTVGDDGEAELA